APSASTCALNTFRSPASGTLDLSTGAASTNVALVSDVYLTSNLAQPCPVCRSGGVPVAGSPSSPATGVCDRGPRATMPCTSTNSSGLTRDCPTGGSSAATNCPNGTGTSPCDCQAGFSGRDTCIDGAHAGPINAALGTPTAPPTTGTAAKADGSGLFCPGQHPTPPNTSGKAGCFGQLTCRSITENG